MSIIIEIFLQVKQKVKNKQIFLQEKANTRCSILKERKKLYSMLKLKLINWSS